MTLELETEIRKATLDPSNGLPVELLGAWRNEPCIFTRRPVPSDAPFPLAIINPAVDLRDFDGLTARRDMEVRDVAFYGAKGEPGTAQDQTRTVEALARAFREFWHRNKWAVQAEGFHIIDVVASGPIAGPTDDDTTVARIVTLRFRYGRAP